MGGDVMFPLGNPWIVQYKASRSGLDASRCGFRINTNGKPNLGIPPNQHSALDALGRSGRCVAVYAFPLVYNDSYFVANMGHLLRSTVFVDATAITNSVASRSSAWFLSSHSITVDSQNQFWVRSKVEGRGTGFSGKAFLTKLGQDLEKIPEKKKVNHEAITQTIRELESAVKEAGVIGRSEHTVSFAVWNETVGKKVIISLPVQFHGLKKKSNRNQAQFSG